MANLRATKNYVFTQEDQVGKGATCEVYRAINKKTGEVHALKIFGARLSTISQREIEALKTLKHENIVSFLGEDVEVSSRKTVAVMEYCNKSLYNMLTEPENRHGLSEDEFMRFFKHLVAGMKHLREHGFLHRDIKPGNILVSQDHDGSFIYKLSDFGTAKPVMETEAFQSLVGTEEYLHPDIFKAAFIDNYVPRKFDAAADLWSLGATLYHAATGNVPFQPYEGRYNKALMFQMIARKEHGVISGTQETKDGEITWSKKLPDSCKLSRWLKETLSVLFARILEVDPAKAWNFDQFFQAADDLVRRLVLCIFCTTSANHFRLYLEPSSRYQDVQTDIQAESGIPAQSQRLRYEECLLSDLVREDTPVSEYPRTTLTSPIILMPTSGVTAGVNQAERQPWYEQPLQVSAAVFGDVIRLDVDAHVARSICDSIAWVQCRVQLSCVTQELFDKITNTTERWTDVLINHFQQEQDLYKERVKDLDHICRTIVTSTTLNWHIAGNGASISKLKEGIRQCNQIGKKIKAIKYDAVNKSVVSCMEENACQKKVARLLEQVKEKREVFQTRKRSKSLPYHVEQLHKFDRKELRNLFESALDLWRNHCQFKLRAVHQHFLTWQSRFADLQANLEQLQRQLITLREDIKSYVKHFKVSEADLETDGPPERCLAGQDKKKQLVASLGEMVSNQQEMSSIVSDTIDVLDKSMKLMSAEDISPLPDLNPSQEELDGVTLATLDQTADSQEPRDCRSSSEPTTAPGSKARLKEGEDDDQLTDDFLIVESC